MENGVFIITFIIVMNEMGKHHVTVASPFPITVNTSAAVSGFVREAFIAISEIAHQRTAESLQPELPHPLVKEELVEH